MTERSPRGISDTRTFGSLTLLLNETPDQLVYLAIRVANHANSNREHYVHVLPTWAFSPEAVLEKLEFLRGIAERVVDDGLPLHATPEERAVLLELAAFPHSHFWWVPDGDGWHTERCLYLSDALFICTAARDLWAILGGEAELRRCQAPAPGHSDPDLTCGQYFVSGGKIGRPKRFCSDACAKRDSRVRKKMAAQRG